MLVFLFLTFLLGVSQSMEIEAESEELDEMLKEAAEIEGKLEELNLEDDASWLAKSRMEELEDTGIEAADQRQTTCPERGTYCHSLYGSCYPSLSGKRCTIVSNNSSFCRSSGCYCCIDCMKDYKGSRCQQKGGYCRKEGGCYPTEIPEGFHPCRSSACSCCRRCSTPSTCRYNGYTNGFCARDPGYYTRYSSVFIDFRVRCNEPQCTCVRYCSREAKCREANGYCASNRVMCRPGYIRYRCGCRDPRNCSCCVPPYDRNGKPNQFRC